MIQQNFSNSWKMLSIHFDHVWAIFQREMGQYVKSVEEWVHVRLISLQKELEERSGEKWESTETVLHQILHNRDGWSIGHPERGDLKENWERDELCSPASDSKHTEYEENGSNALSVVANCLEVCTITSVLCKLRNKWWCHPQLLTPPVIPLNKLNFHWCSIFCNTQPLIWQHLFSGDKNTCIC